MQDLTYRESLHCIKTAFSLLSGFGASLNIDPMRFYTHLYKTLFHLHAGMLLAYMYAVKYYVIATMYKKSGHLAANM